MICRSHQVGRIPFPIVEKQLASLPNNAESYYNFAQRSPLRRRGIKTVNEAPLNSKSPRNVGLKALQNQFARRLVPFRNIKSVVRSADADVRQSDLISEEFRALGSSLPPEGLILFLAGVIGVVGGSAVVLFNLTEHEVHELLWSDVPKAGASWLRHQPLSETWTYLIFVPLSGGIANGVLNTIRASLEESVAVDQSENTKGLGFRFKSVLIPAMKAFTAAITLGTGNSMGPEGPCVEIGASVATGISSALNNSKERRLAMVAAGSAAGISSVFNAAVSGCFFAMENVLRSSASSAGSLPTAMILLSAVLASVVSQAVLGSNPALRVVAYDFKSPAELPLYILLGVLCGSVSILLTRGSQIASQGFRRLNTETGIHPFFFPAFGSLTVGCLALVYPEILYWGWVNMNDLLAPEIASPYEMSAMLLLQLVFVKVLATAICRGSGMVGGAYAPSLFIGASLGSCYGKVVTELLAMAGPAFDVDWLHVAAPQAYAMVGMAATLAGVCQVPLTSVLLLFELTRDYRIILPLMATVGISSWLASTSIKKQKELAERKMMAEQQQAEVLQPAEEGKGQNGAASAVPSASVSSEGVYLVGDALGIVVDEQRLLPEISAASAMRTYFAYVEESAYLRDAMAEMIGKKEWCVLVLGKSRTLRGILTLADIQEEAIKLKSSKQGQSLDMQKMTVGEMCRRRGGKLVVVSADASLEAAVRLMSPRGLRQIPVLAVNPRTNVSSDSLVIGLLDRECIDVACRAEATRRTILMTPRTDLVAAVQRQSRVNGTM